MRLIASREVTAVLLTASQNFNIGMHLDVYEPIWFKLNMMVITIKFYVLINTPELYFFILV